MPFRGLSIRCEGSVEYGLTQGIMDGKWLGWELEVRFGDSADAVVLRHFQDT